MKTLKKTLCLVLAVVMVVGALVLPASAAAYKDLADITNTDYKTAVTTLQDWRVMEGDATGNFKPKASIQRQEMAAIIYRLLTGDNKGYGKDNSAIYTPYAAKFTDVDAKGWAAGYIGYCANKGIIVGTNPEQTTFEPTREIPGNDVLCMLLRALGYGMNKEYQGADWAKHVAADAARLHLTDKITAKLDAVSERQEVAQMTYKAATAARVTWSNSEKDYIPYVDPNDPNSNANIPLVYVDPTTTSDQTYDDFGSPKATTTTHTIWFTYPVNHKSFTWTTTNAKPALKEYWTAVTECQVAKDTDVTGAKITYTNGILNVGSDTIVDTDTVNTIGHQGRHTLVYADRIVYIDTYLARVTDTTVEVLDPAGHVITEATADLAVYSNHVANPNRSTATQSPAATRIMITTSIDNTGNKYAVGDMLRVTVLTDDPYNAFVDDIEVVDVEKVTTESVTIASIERDAANWDLHGVNGNTLTEVGFTGTNGKTYLYNYTYGYNTEAAPVNGSSVQRIVTQDIGKTYTVYLDSHDNVLGVDLKPVSDIGVVTSVNIALVTGTTNQYVVAYNVLMPDRSNVTVYGVDPNTQKPYTSAANAQAAANAFWNENANPAPVLVNGENKDAGILARITPIANGYYRVVAAGTAGSTDANNSYTGTLAPNRVLERGEANAFWLAQLTNTFSATSTGSNYPAYIGGVGPTTINNVLVDDTTVYFVANYDYNYTADEYQFKNFTISTGFKSIMDLSYDNTQPNASTAPGSLTGTADIDGQPQARLNLEVSAFDTDTDGYADYVLVLNANKQQEPTPVTVLNYAYLMNNRRFASTSSDQNAFGAIIDGVADQRLTLTAVASQSVLDTGLYTYANQTINGWSAVNFVSPSTATATGNPVWGIAATTGAQGWLVKDGVLVVDPTSTATGSSMNRGQFNGTTFNGPAVDKYLTIANDCKVFLVNPTTGSSTPQPYALTTLDDFEVYGTNEIVYQFDANGYVNLIYIVAKGDAETTRDPATTITRVVWTPSGTAVVKGESTAWSSTQQTVTGNNSSIFVAPSANSVSISLQWEYLVETSAADAKWVKAGDNFLDPSGVTYRLVVTFTANNGYAFASNFTAGITRSITGFTGTITKITDKTVTAIFTANPAAAA